MGAFVGSEREEILKHLVSLFDEVIEKSRPHLVCLTAEVGWGKTRIIQELYSYLRQDRQGERPYWPPLIDVDEADVMEARKVIYPERIVAPADVPIPWLWWGLRCDVDSSGRPIRALLNDRVQLVAHFEALASLAARRKGDRDLVLGLLGEVVGFIPFVGMPISMARASATLGPKLFQRIKNGMDRQHKRNPGTDIDVTSHRIARREIDADLALIQRLVTPEMPLVLIVDDAHEADPITVEFLSSLMEMSGCPILIIATAWPSALAPAVGVSADSEIPTFPVLLKTLARDHPTDVSVIELTPLEDDDLLRLIREVGPNTTLDRQTALLNASDGNLLVLNLQLASRKVARSVRNGAIQLGTDELEELPQAFENLIAERFHELEEASQLWLAEAALVHGSPFFPAFLQRSSVAVDADVLSRFIRLQDQGEFPVGRFIELPVLNAIRAEADDLASRTEVTTWWLNEQKLVEAWWDAGPAPVPSDSRTRAALWKLVAENTRRVATLGESERWDVAASSAIDWSIRESALDDHEEALAAAQFALECVQSGTDLGDPLVVHTLVQLSDALRAVNDLEPALQRADEAVRIVESGDVSRDLKLAALLAQVGALEQMENYARVDDVLLALRVLASEHADDELAVIQLEAKIRAEQGNSTAARELLQRASALAAQMNDIESQVDIQLDLVRLDPFLGSVERWKELTSLAEKELGAGHWLHCSALTSLVVSLVLNGNITEARAEFERLHTYGNVSQTNLQQVHLMLDAVEGDGTAVSDLLAFQEIPAPYSNYADIQASAGWGRLRSQMYDLEPTLPQGEDPTFSLLADIVQSLDKALPRVIEYLSDPSKVGSDNLLIIGFSAMACLEAFVVGNLWPEEIEHFIELAETIVQQPNFPEMQRAQVKALCDVKDILDGHFVDNDGETNVFTVDLYRTLASAVAWRRIGQTEKAESQMDRVMALVDANPNRRIGFQIYLVIASAMVKCSDRRAEEMYERALSVASEPQGRIRVLLAIGHSKFACGDYGQAAEVESEALDLARSIGSSAGILKAGRDLAATLTYRLHVGDTDRAIDLYAEIETLPSPDTTRQSFFTWHGSLLHKAGRIDEAEIVESRSWELAKELGDPEIVVAAGRNLAVTLSERDHAGDLERAIDLYAEIEALPSPDTTRQRFFKSHGYLLYKAGRFDEAEIVESRSWELAKELGDPEIIVAAGRNLAATLTYRLHVGDTDRAIDLYAEIEALPSPDTTRQSFFTWHGRLLHKAGRFDEAEIVESRSWELAKELGDPKIIVTAGRNLAFTLSERAHAGDLERALGLCSELTDLATNPRVDDWIRSEAAALRCALGDHPTKNVVSRPDGKLHCRRCGRDFPSRTVDGQLGSSSGDPPKSPVQ